MARLDETRLDGVIEAVFSQEPDDPKWLYQVLAALAALCRTEQQYLGVFYDASDATDLRLWNVCAAAGSHELAAAFAAGKSALAVDFAQTVLRGLHVGSARRTGTADVAPFLSELARSGIGDVLCVNGLDSTGVGCLLLIGCRAHEFEPSPAELFVYRCVAANLAAAFRCRRQLARSQARAERRTELAPEVSGADWTREASEPLPSREPLSCTGIARERVRNSGVALGALRPKSSRRAWWNALSTSLEATSSRLTLVDTFEESGRRYIVARENVAQGISTLTGRERQIVARAALGFSNKQIAYDLGISDATVRVLMARAASRVGVRTRRELLAHPALEELFPAGSEPHAHRASDDGNELPASTH